MNLTNKQKQFCEEYLIDLNATKAAIRAGYSKKTANEIAAQNLAKLSIQNYISQLKEKRNKRVQLTQDEVLKELKLFAFSDITQTMLLSFDEIKQLPEDIRRMISSYKKTTTTFGEDGLKESYEIKFIDKMKAFEMLNRHIGFYEEDNSQKNESIIVTVGKK